MGVVHLAQREADGAVVAVKRVVPAVAPRPGTMERFLREANILRELDHPNVVRFREMGCVGGQLFFAMDYVPGTDAARLLRERGPFPVRLGARLLCQVLLALEHAHAKRFVHRDVKPANILLEGKKPPLKIRVADFGLARAYHASQLSGLTLETDIGGTFAFMPPEQVTSYRDVRPPADQYSAAATLYYLLCGSFVHDLRGPIAAQLDVILKAAAVPLRERRPDLPADLAAVVHRALARAPEDRYESVFAFREALLPFAR
jgi:serine/threonine-protein kinase